MCLVTGGRIHDESPCLWVNHFDNPFYISLAIHERMIKLPVPAHVIHGDAPGADRMFAFAAASQGHFVQAFPAEWKVDGVYNPRAGFERNIQMLDESPDLVIAAWDGSSHGTAHTIKEARRRGIPVEVLA